MGDYQTEQESFWAGNFGDDYSQRNVGDQWVASNLSLFSKVFDRTTKVDSVLELGANIGLNLRAIRLLRPAASINAVEINGQAVEELKSQGGIEVHHKSILEFKPEKKYDFVFTKGVLIHLNPDALPSVYDLMYEASSRYILVAEYYNPSPQSIPYRGHDDRLFKRDFAGELMERHPNTKLVDYGFVYRRDPNYPQDDISWFLIEKLG